jgi:hypothetical protein
VQLLREPEIMLARDYAEFTPVFFEVILQKMFGAKSLSARKSKHRYRQNPRRQSRISGAPRRSCFRHLRMRHLNTGKAHKPYIQIIAGVDSFTVLKNS